MWTFIAGQRESRGVLASRFFRRPSEAFLAPKLLDIRPFSDEGILHALSRYPRFSPDLQKRLFRNRTDLVPVARNPFLMALLGAWVEEHGALPETQAQMYESYLRVRLSRSRQKFSRHALSPDDVLTATTEIAWFIFTSKAYQVKTLLCQP